MIDSHCHLTDSRFDGDREAVLRRAHGAGVRAVVTIASDASDSEAVARLLGGALGEADRPSLYGTAGIHPHAAEAAGDSDLDRVRDLAEASRRVVAIGETGLDFYYDNSPRQAQRQLFESQLALAGELELPVVVHSRSADRETAALIREHGRDVCGVLHCFTAGPELLEAGLEADWYVSFSGIVSFKRFDGQDLVRDVPEGRLMIETDAPYLAPVPHRGKRNEPAFVARVLEAVADIRGVDADRLRRTTEENARRFYGLEA